MQRPIDLGTDYEVFAGDAGAEAHPDELELSSQILCMKPNDPLRTSGEFWPLTKRLHQYCLCIPTTCIQQRGPDS
jgi:hypothetical protein